MSRVLAELLSQNEPAFRLQLAWLEAAAGAPAADIRLMMHVVGETREKIRALGLDPHDTTGQELFAALRERLLADEARLREALGVKDAGQGEVLAAVKRQLDAVDMPMEVFVMKQSVVRQLYKKLQPKATMKKLGYRSMDSMIKHEPVPQLVAATALCESRDWHKKRLEAARKLQPKDFEIRRISFQVPTAKQWPKLAAHFVGEHKHNILSLPEVGAVMLLPIDRDLPALAITTMLLCLQYVNEIRAQSSYLKLQQVRPDFGQVVHDILLHEPMTKAELGGEQLPWSMVQWFYGHGHSSYQPGIFEPHVQPEDLSWHEAESVLTSIHPALEFWAGSELLGLVDNGQPVSLNMLDMSIAVCNGLDYSQRLVHYMQSALSKELLGRYLHHENLQEMLLGKLNQQLVPEPSFELE